MKKFLISLAIVATTAGAASAQTLLFNASPQVNALTQTNTVVPLNISPATAAAVNTGGGAAAAIAATANRQNTLGFNAALMGNWTTQHY